MRVIGVIDLRAGRAVHARAGDRERYAPVTSVAGHPLANGDPVALARAYVDRLGIREVYVADLDAILGGATQDTVIRSIAELGVPVWLDTAIATVEAARHAHGLGAAHIVVGLETLPSFDVLDDICLTIGGGRAALSLDLRDGRPMWRDAEASPASIAARAAAAGVGTLLAIDLARVGTGAGPDLQRLAEIRAAAPGVTLVAGGGVRGTGDLNRLAAAGCDGALVATALHSGFVRS